MDITSFLFFAFVGVSLLIYCLVPHKFQWLVLLADSLIFYFLTVEPYTFIYIIISVFTVWAAALYFRKVDDIKKKRIVLALTVILNVGILVALKYTNMFIGTFNYWTGKSIAEVNWIAPLAISYYTLSLVSYLVDCYGEAFEPEKDPLKLLLFTIYFPQMVSGPICRYSQTGTQLFEEHRFDHDRVLSGIRRVLWGLLKKVVVADRIAMIVNVMFDYTYIFSGLWVIVSACLFMIQLFFDFSGCMDIVTGISKCFGIILPENFNVPFLSKSVQEFWSRWHITLGAWLKDYVMFPISRTNSFKSTSKKLKNKWGKWGQKIPYYAAMFVVWTLMGIWHGSSWKYMIGQGWFFWIVIVSGQVFEPVFKKLKSRLHINEKSLIWNAFQVIRTFLLVSIGNIAFRAESLAQTFIMYKRAFVWNNGITKQLRAIREGIPDFGGIEALIVVCALGIIQIVCDFRQYAGKNNQELITKRPIVIRWAIYYLSAFIVFYFSLSTTSEFLYFQF